MKSYVHIISFDIPYPANYGGAIDVFYKIRCLHQEGVEVILHCFQYGDRFPSEELEKWCAKVYYYKRSTSFINQLSLLPYNVKSRTSKQLKENLVKDSYPILFEVLHTCYLLNDSDLKQRKKLFRHSNIEHDYFNELAKADTSFFKKMYLKIEAFKLKRFEKQITHADYILSVSEKDLLYFKKTYPNTPSVYLPSFHQYNELNCKTGKGDYLLYHGNLAISENYQAALWLIEHVFFKVSYPVIIAGLNPPQQLIDCIQLYNHIELKQNCSEQEMQDLIANAHIHCLYTQQGTGLKLKLLNVLYSGRFVIANDAMLVGTRLTTACEVCNSSEEYISKINELMPKEFNSSILEQRKSIVTAMNNKEKTKQLLELINSI